MKKFQKFLLVSTALSAILSPLSAIDIVDEDDKKLSVYGSVLGYTGFGSTGNHTTATAADKSTTTNGQDFGSALYGLQTNSRIGFDAKVGNIKAKVEIGLKESSLGDEAMLPVRKLWGSYSFGSAGTLLLGRDDTPSVVGSGFTSDVANTDQGQAGFGALRTANRRFQIAYSVSGLTIALVDDSTGMAIGNKQNEAIPRIAASYNFKNEDETLNIKVGGAYKYYNKGIRGEKTAEPNERFQGLSGSAFHLYVAAKSQLLEKKLYVSTIIHGGMNADLYGEQETSVSYGNYAHSKLLGDITGNDITRIGGYLEAGYKLSDTLSAVLGGGYQYTFLGHNAPKTSFGIHTYAVMAQLPVKLQKGFTITPQVGYYGTNVATSTTEDPKASGSAQNSGLLALVRLRYDF